MEYADPDGGTARPHDEDTMRHAIMRTPLRARASARRALATAPVAASALALGLALGSPASASQTTADAVTTAAASAAAVLPEQASQTAASAVGQASSSLGRSAAARALAGLGRGSAAAASLETFVLALGVQGMDSTSAEGGDGQGEDSSSGSHPSGGGASTSAPGALPTPASKGAVGSDRAATGGSGSGSSASPSEQGQGSAASGSDTSGSDTSGNGTAAGSGTGSAADQDGSAAAGTALSSEGTTTTGSTVGGTTTEGSTARGAQTGDSTAAGTSDGGQAEPTDDAGSDAVGADRGTAASTVACPTTSPTAPVSDPSGLTARNAGSLSGTRTEGTVTLILTPEAAHANPCVAVYTYPGGATTGWIEVSDARTVTVDVSSLSAGTYELAVAGEHGELLGWAELSMPGAWSGTGSLVLEGGLGVVGSLSADDWLLVGAVAVLAAGTSAFLLLTGPGRRRARHAA